MRSSFKIAMLQLEHWNPASKMSYRAETCWSALCAFLKEDILELLYSGHRNEPAKIRYALKGFVFSGNS
jgi:hypothetical protein